MVSGLPRRFGCHDTVSLAKKFGDEFLARQNSRSAKAERRLSFLKLASLGRFTKDNLPFFIVTSASSSYRFYY